MRGGGGAAHLAEDLRYGVVQVVVVVVRLLLMVVLLGGDGHAGGHRG